jgi:sulfonate transport system substrate-binding protein
LQAITAKRDALADFVRRLGAARLWALDNTAAYAKVWARIVGVDARIAQLTFSAEHFRPVLIDDTVIADQQKTSDAWTEAGVIPRRLDARQAFDASFNASLGL